MGKIQKDKRRKAKKKIKEKLELEKVIQLMNDNRTRHMKRS